MPGSSKGRFSAVGAAVVAVAVCAGAAAGAPQTTAPLPGVGSMVLAPGDFASGGKVATQQSFKSLGNPSYMRVFKPGARLGTSPLLEVVSQATLYPDVETAAADVVNVRRQTRTKRGRQALAREFAALFAAGAGKNAVKVRKSVVGAPRKLRSSSLKLPMTLTTSIGTFRFAIVYSHVDRVTESTILLGLIGKQVAARDSSRVAAVVEGRLRAVFTVASTAAPTVTGTPQQGQTLTAGDGDWTGAPSSFDYAWKRCDATGATCVPIDGATAATYTVGPDDAGATLRAVVTGSNSVTSQQAISEPTAAVPAPTPAG